MHDRLAIELCSTTFQEHASEEAVCCCTVLQAAYLKHMRCVHSQVWPAGEIGIANPFRLLPTPSFGELRSVDELPGIGSRKSLAWAGAKLA